MTNHRLIIPGQPITFGRPATYTNPQTGEQRRHNSPRYNQWREDAAKVIALTRRGLTYDGPVIVNINVHSDGISAEFCSAVPSSRPKGVTGDLDNYVKAVLDAAQSAHLITDDRNVHAVHAAFAGDEPLPHMTRRST